MLFRKFSILLFLGILVTIVSCNKESLIINRYDVSDYSMMSEHLDIPENPHDYAMQIPSILGNPVAFNNDKATLGRVLFYDTDLSADKSISCASCHKQELAFSDNVAFSEGVFGNHSARNSIGLGSVLSFQVYYSSLSSSSGIPFLWDNSAGSADELSRMALTADNEMGLTMDEVLTEVNSKPYYQPLIGAAYGSEQISETDLLDALSEFVRSIGTFDSKFDEELNGLGSFSTNPTTLANSDWNGFSSMENMGKNIYMTDCTGCHSPINARPIILSSNNGLYDTYTDHGISNGQIEDHFKVPSLRNLKYTAPYMHDGSLATIEEVIEHYSSGVKASENLPNELKYSNGTPLHRNYTQEEKDALKAFLLTMTDETVRTEVKWSDPFK